MTHKIRIEFDSGVAYEICTVCQKIGCSECGHCLCELPDGEQQCACGNGEIPNIPVRVYRNDKTWGTVMVTKSEFDKKYRDRIERE